MKTTYSTRLLDVMPAIADLIPDYVPGMTAISRIHVLPLFRNLGYGTMLMNKICRDADKESVTLCLEINPYGDLDYDQLAEWYKGFGFAKDDSQQGLFVRKPA